MTKYAYDTEEGNATWGDNERYPSEQKTYGCCGVIYTQEYHSYSCLCYVCVNSDAMVHTCPKQPMLCALIWAGLEKRSKLVKKLTEPENAKKYAEHTNYLRRELPLGIGGKYAQLVNLTDEYMSHVGITKRTREMVRLGTNSF